MTVLGISGSPRRHGNTEVLLDKVLEGAKSRSASVGKIVLNELDFKGCQDCGGCSEEGVCILTDDMREVYKRIEKADCIVIASPVFFGTISAQLKSMIDRFQPAWIKKNIFHEMGSDKKQKGVFLCVSGADNKEFFDNSRRSIKMFFNTIGAKYAADIYCGGVEGKNAIRNKKRVLDKAFELGEKIVTKNRKHTKDG